MKFRRKADETGAETAAEPEATPTVESGPFDAAQVEGDDVQRVDLGSVLVPPIEGRELRLQVDEQSGVVRAVILAGLRRRPGVPGLRRAPQRRPVVDRAPADRRRPRQARRRGHRA